MRHRITRPLVAVCVIATAAIGLSACSGSGAGSSTGGNTLSITWNKNEQPGIEAVIAAFQAENPGVTVNLSGTDGGGQGQAALRTRLSSGTATDIEWVWPGNGNAGAIRQLAVGDFFVDLSGSSWASQYPEAMQDEVSVDGKVVMMAPAQMAFPLIVNQTALDAAGLKAPTNWDELLQYCTDAKAKGLVGLSVPGGELYGALTTIFNLVADNVYADGTQFDDQLVSGETTFPTNPGWIAAMDKFTQLRDSDCYSPDFTGLTFDDSNKAVASGQALGGFIAGVLIGQLQSLNPDATFSMVSFNAGDPGGKDMTVIQTIGGGAIPKSSKNIDLATKFIDFLGTHTDVYANAIPGNIPTTAQNYSPPGPNEAFLVDAVTNGTAVHYPDLLWPSASTDGEMLNGLQGIDLGTETGASVLEKMQAALTQ